MRFDPNTRTTWPAGHVVHMSSVAVKDHGHDITLSVARCDCGWLSQKPFGPEGSAAQDWAIERHWRQVEGKGKRRHVI